MTDPASDAAPIERHATPPWMLTAFLWLAAGVLMILSARLVSVSRTQEARVLETAREMLGQPFAGWMIPHANGEIRLHKPPLAYWATAGAFKVLGTSAWSGRVAAVLAGWLTLGVTFLIARRLFDRTVALFAAAALVGSYVFFKFSLLAETDIYATFFVTLGIYGVLRAVERPRAIGWQHWIAASMALAVLAKGPPAAYVLLFYIVLCIFRRNGWPLVWFLLSGAIVTFALIGVPWFAYIHKQGLWNQLIADLRNSAEGGKGHANWPHVYIPMFTLGIAPWTAMWAVAIAAALRHVWRRIKPWQGVDAIFTLLLWGIVIGLPLMGWGNKQIHYLLPLMPPTMILVGYAVAGAITGKGRFHDLARVVLIVTAGALLLTPILPPLLARTQMDPPEIRQIDWLACGVLTIIACVAVWNMRRDAWRGVACSAALMASTLMFTITLENKALENWPTERMAQELWRVHPNAHYVFRGDASLSLCFALNQVIPSLNDMGLAGRMFDAKTVVIERTDHVPDTVAPVGYVEEGRIGEKKDWLRVFVPIKIP